MDNFRFLASLRSGCSTADRLTLNFLRSHANLMIALAVLFLCIWSSSNGFAPFVFGIILVGAISYFLGIAMALISGLLFTVGSAWAAGSSLTTIAPWIVQLGGYCCIAWLGYRHKEQRDREERRKHASHEPQVLPWAVTNEVRTSLAAVRFLLFPLHTDDKNQELQKVSEELSRLEHLFKEMELNTQNDPFVTESSLPPRQH